MMNALSYSVLTVVFLFGYNTDAHNLQYQHLEDMGADCPPRDTCSIGGQRSFSAMNCECDYQCLLYKDCCIDAETRRSTIPLTNITCIPAGSQNKGVYVINKCQNGWRGPAQVRQRCETLNDFSDPLVATPITDTENKVTYKNFYCAECNDADRTHLKSWIIRISCQSLKEKNATGNITGEYINERLTYKTTYPNRNKWGIYYWNDEADRDTFYPCELTFKLPQYLTDSVRLCRSNVISTCPSNWRQNTVRRNCDAYMAVVYTNSGAYRNPHCAYCNGQDFENLACALGLLSRKKPPMSFTLLLDINLNDGNRVGEINPCANNQKYDSFFKKCRNLVCAIPGYRLEGDRCVRG